MMATTLLLLIASILLSTKATAQTATPAGPINLIKILENGEQFSTFIRLLNITQIGSLVNIQLDNSAEMTIFAPSDKAFQDLKPGTLNKLSSDELLKLVLYHIIPKFYTIDDLLSVSKPVRTQASGRDNGVYGLTFTGQTNQIKVSTGYVKTRISDALRKQRPLGVYVVDMVLLPGEMFKEHMPTAKSSSNKSSSGEHKISPIAHAPKSSSSGFFDNSIKNPAASPSDKSSSGEMFGEHKISPVAHAPKSSSSRVDSTKKSAASPSDKSGSREKKLGLGFGLGLVVFCLKFLF